MVFEQQRLRMGNICEMEKAFIRAAANYLMNR